MLAGPRPRSYFYALRGRRKYPVSDTVAEVNTMGSDAKSKKGADKKPDSKAPASSKKKGK